MNPSIDIIELSLNSSSGLPASFNGNIYIYTIALFCSFFTLCLCLTQIVHIVREMLYTPAPRNNPLTAFRTQILLVYLLVLMRVTPDTVYLWTFNEISADLTLRILTWGRVFNSLSLIPLLGFTYLYLRTKGEISFQLIKNYTPLNLGLGGNKVSYYSVITAVIFMLSLAVSLAK